MLLDRETAEAANDHVLKAFRHLIEGLQLVEGKVPDATYQDMKRSVGVAIGSLDIEFLCHIYRVFRDLDTAK